MTAVSLADLAAEMSRSRSRLERHAAASEVGARLARFVGRLASRIDKPPRIVLLGEFNAGKSTLANALIGAELLPTSILSNTRIPVLVHYAETASLRFERSDGERRPLTIEAIEGLRPGEARLICVGLPQQRLKRYELVDTPGLATGQQSYDALVEEAWRRSNIAIWCTTGTQAWKATELAMWQRIPVRLQQRGVLVVTRLDAISEAQQRDRLEQRLRAEAIPHFSSFAMIDAIAAEAVRRAGDAPGYAVRWRDCGGRDLENQIEAAVDNELLARRVSAERLLARTARRLGA